MDNLHAKLVSFVTKQFFERKRFELYHRKSNWVKKCNLVWKMQVKKKKEMKNITLAQAWNCNYISLIYLLTQTLVSLKNYIFIYVQLTYILKSQGFTKVNKFPTQVKQVQVSIMELTVFTSFTCLFQYLLLYF